MSGPGPAPDDAHGHGGSGAERADGGPECAAGVCVTCSDAAVPARVVALLGGDLAMADAGAGEEEISVALVDARPGDTVLVHAKEAIAVVGPQAPTGEGASAVPAPGSRADSAGSRRSGETMSTTPGDVDSLYPFLYGTEADPGRVRAEVERSIADKAREIVALREEMGRVNAGRIAACARALARSFAAGGRLFAFGNGGSSTDGHAIAELFANPGPGARPLPALALTSEAAVLTALGNDVAFDVIFARQVAAFGRPGDIAVGLSTSGGSADVVLALEEARRRGMTTVGFAGYDGGRMAESGAVDHLFVVPSSSVHRIQEAQTTTYHVVWELTQRALRSRPA